MFASHSSISYISREGFPPKFPSSAYDLKSQA